MRCTGIVQKNILTARGGGRGEKKSNSMNGNDMRHLCIALVKAGDGQLITLDKLAKFIVIGCVCVCVFFDGLMHIML